MVFDSIVFDLDGTLWDTTPAIVVAWNKCVERVGVRFRAIGDEDIRRVTGKPHDECVRLVFEGLSENEIQSLIEMTAVEDSQVIEELGGRIYDGVPAGLRRLRERFPLFIVSNCQSGYIETFLRSSGFGSLFQDFECFGNTGESKGHNLARLIARNGLRSPVMVGDAAGDERAARECGIPFYFMTYGFDQALAPERSFDSFPELVDYLTK